jgi:hypothetical protein
MSLAGSCFSSESAPFLPAFSAALACPRSTPSTKRFIQSPAVAPESLLPESHEAPGFYTARVKRGHDDNAAGCPLYPLKADIGLSNAFGCQE